MLMMSKNYFMFVYNTVSINYVSFTANSSKFPFISPMEIVNLGYS